MAADPRAVIHDSAALTDLFGPACPACGWRQGRHRPEVIIGRITYLTACPDGTPEETP